MKKLFALLIGVLLFQISYGQDESDALRYSYLTPGGTARMQAIGNASVSLGGDAGTMGLNPAGIGLFKTNDLSITPGFRLINNQSEYMDNTASDTKSNLFLQQLGLIFASNKRQGSNTNWQNVTFGVGLNRLANFNQNIYYQGNNNQTSYADNYLITLDQDNLTDNQSDLNNIAQNYPFGLSQAYLTGLLGPVYDNGVFAGWNTLPGQILDGGKNITQSNAIHSKGGLNEFTIAVAGNYADKFYLGLSLNVPSINFNRTKSFRETNMEDKDSPLKYYDVTDKLNTDGVGFNGKLGVIYAINHKVRIGASFHSPTIFSMHDTYTTTLMTSTKDQGDAQSTTTDITDGYPGDYDYSLTTPWRMMGGISVVFGASENVKQQHGFVSLDYEYVNYAAARFHFNSDNATPADKDFESSLNNSISSIYKGTSNIRLGGEMKFNILAVRAGINWMGSPYSDEDIKGDQFRYSAGIGIRNRGIYADLTYVYSTGNNINQPYYIKENEWDLQSPPAATIKSNASNIVLTFGLKL